ncbi:hypothetical protein FOXYS1_820 [Fusarium oxysporum]|uniref:Uncharacterized protein n=1 Tax=Fusarium oxysporum TaxID=5507 RepID=A0A8H5EPS4_FUSOX|nr:hypothetical protein FOXYS1_820 [Fusarium oxysporum]
MEGWGNELLCLAASQGCLPVIERLMKIAQQSIDLRKELLRGPQRQPRSLTHQVHQSIGEAVLAGYVGVVEYLLEQEGIETHLHHRNANGENVLHLASVQCNPAMFWALTPRFPDGISQRDRQGKTALMRVVENSSTSQNRIESAQALLSPSTTHQSALSTEDQQEVLQMTKRMHDEVIKDFEKIIASIPEGLAEIYQRHLSAIPVDYQDDATNLLKLLLSCLRLMHLDELNIAFTINDSRITADDVLRDTQNSMAYTVQGILGTRSSASVGNGILTQDPILLASQFDLDAILNNLLSSCEPSQTIQTKAFTGHPGLVIACSPDDPDNSGATPLFWAVGGGHHSIISTLARLRCIDLNHRDKTGRTAISWASGDGMADTLAKLLKLPGIDVNIKDDKGKSPLSWAAANGCASAVEVLLTSTRVDKASVDDDKRNAISWAQFTELFQAMATYDLAVEALQHSKRATWILK